MGTMEHNTRQILEIFHKIEERNPLRLSPERLLELLQPDIQFEWPPSLPFAMAAHGANTRPITWDEVWNPLQPTATERKMDPRVVAASDDEVVVLWRQRGLSSTGERYEGEVLGLYRFRDGRLARAKMFYFDPDGAAAFLARANAGPVGRQVYPAPLRFLVVFKPGPKWVTGKRVFEQPLAAHSEYMQKLYDERKLLYAGPFLDDRGGLAILSVASDAEAREILAQEPATQEQIFVAEAHPWHLTFDATQGRSLFQGKK